MAVGLVDETGRILRQARIPTRTFDETVPAVLEVVREMAGEAVGIGIGCTGPHLPSGVLLNDDTLTDWKGRNLLDAFRPLGLPVVLENDADAALVGEVFYGSDRTQSDQPAAMLTFGTGVGGAVWTGTGIWRGAFGEHPEIGHLVVQPDGPKCYCGAHGCLEVLAAGPAIHAAATEAGFKVLDTFFASDHPSVDRIRQAIHAGIWTIAHTFRPATLILGGGIMEAYFDRLVPWHELTPQEATMLLHPMQILPATLGNEAGLVGAAKLAR